MNTTSATSGSGFLPTATATADEVGPGPLHHVAETGSTNADLVAEAREGNGDGCVLVADHQTAGRGRLDRRWEDDRGALLVSMRVPVDGADAAATVRALSAAARAAIDRACAARILAKWPNDLVTQDAPAPGKLAGVLAEFVPGPVPCVVIGLGVNMVPVAGQEGASSVVECGGPDDRDAVLDAILREFAARRADPMAVLAELRSNSATLGSQVRVELPGSRSVEGRAVDLTDDGELVVHDESGGRHVIGVGDVVHLRPA